MRLKTLGLRPRCTEKVQVTQETSFPFAPVPPQENIENKRLKKRAILATRMLLLESLVVSVPELASSLRRLTMGFFRTELEDTYA